MADPTTNYDWDLPRDQGDSGAWGNLLNAIFEDLDTVLAGIEDTADDAMPKAGGVFTGEIDILTARYEVKALGSVSGTTTLNLSVANYFHGAMSGAVTIAFSNVPATGHFVGIILELTGNGSALNWPSSVEWPGGSAPDAPANGDTNIYVLFTRDGGTTWRASLALADVS